MATSLFKGGVAIGVFYMRPSLRLSILFNPLKTTLSALNMHEAAISTMIVSRGPASAYALVWEYGNIRQTKKGPKTTLGVDPETGARIWHTIQAPSGYVRIWKPTFRRIILEEINKVRFLRHGASGASGRELYQQLTEAWSRIGERMTERIKSTVPVDSGDLKGSITFIPGSATSLRKSFSGVKGF
jgi:hypothetical protein